MSKKSIEFQILEHPNKDEIISKLILGTSCSDINEWLDVKYGALNNRALVISETGLSKFKNVYLDFYTAVRDDLTKMQEKKADPSIEVNLALQNNKDYANKLNDHIEKEIDIKSKMIGFFNMAENRMNQIYDIIQQNPASFKGDRYLIDWFDKIGLFLEKYHKLVLVVPEASVQHNITFNVIDQHASTIQNAIKKTLMAMDVETSLKFMEILTKELDNLKEVKEGFKPIEDRYIEAQLLEEKTADK